ncbi:hypothetical protein EON80_16155, partial [bacterium]
MKPHLLPVSLLVSLLVTLLLGPTPVPASAQTPEVSQAPLLATTDPAVAAIVSRAIESYRGATGISFNHQATFGRIDTFRSLVRYQGPDTLRIDTPGVKTITTFVMGDVLTKVRGLAYGQIASPYGRAPLSSGIAGKAGEMIAAMMAGKAPLAAKDVALAPRQFDNEPAGDLLE